MPEEKSQIMSNLNALHDESLKYYSMVTKLIHYTSKFGATDDGRNLKQNSSNKNRRLSSSVDLLDKSSEIRRFRIAPIWPEWNDAEINLESWDTGNIKRKDTGSVKSRADAKANASIGAHAFEDPDGKIELPSSLKVEQWKRPIDFLPPDRPPIIVDPEFGINNIDLITSNEHLHQNETMRNIISEMTTLWEICRKERTWRPWEHIYAINKVSKAPFITPYNPAGKYVVRLFFLGTWRKIIIDDSMPLDSQNRCLLPQTTFNYELWPMLLTKALLKIVSLEYEYGQTSIIHLLTGWIPELIPIKYNHAEQIWNYLHSGPLTLFKWAASKIDNETEKEPSEHPEENMTKKFDDKSSKKGTILTHPSTPKESSAIKSPGSKENRSYLTVKDVKKAGGTHRKVSTDDFSVPLEEQFALEAPKIVILATISHLHTERLSSLGEMADRSERLRHYNLNETFSTSVLLTTIRDIPLEPPPPTPSAPIPAWKLIRPRKPFVLPNAEPIPIHIDTQMKPDRWIEIVSPYISYPTSSTLHIRPTVRPHGMTNIIPKHSRTDHQLRRQTALLDPLNIVEIDEDDNCEKQKSKSEFQNEFIRSTTSISLPTTKNELAFVDSQEKIVESVRSAGNKWKRKLSRDNRQNSQKSIGNTTKLSSGESEQTATGSNTQANANTNEQQSSQSISSNSIKKTNQVQKIWMDFDDFCTCFTSIIVFHNPRAYAYHHKHTEIKFTPYQSSVYVPPMKEKKKESVQTIVQQIPNLIEDKSLYLFVDSTRETFDRSIELIISLSSLPRWYDAIVNEPVVTNEKVARSVNVSVDKLSSDAHQPKNIISQKDIKLQTGTLLAEVYSWKSLVMGQPILRIHTTATKSSLLTLPPGRHVLKITNTCPFAYNLQILSDTNDFLLGDEDQLLNKILSVPEDIEFINRAEELLFALDDAIQSFHLVPQYQTKLYELFRLYCQHTSNLTMETCVRTFHQALYSTIRTVMQSTGSNVNSEIQFAWRCFTNDRQTVDILGAHEIKRPSATSGSRHSTRTGGSSATSTGGVSSGKRSAGAREKSLEKLPATDLQDEIISDWLTRTLLDEEINAILNIQKISRGFLQRRMNLARQLGTEKNLNIQRILQTTMSLIKNDFNKSALILFKHFLSIKPQLIQCFSFRDDDWNMVTYRDYQGIYQEQSANSWFVLFREIFYVMENTFLAAKFLSHLSNSILRVINNDTYEEVPLIFNRLAPEILTKNQNGYTFFAEGLSTDQVTPIGRFRLRLITSYAHLPEARNDQITSSFFTKEIQDYYIPNKEELICKYRVILAEDINQTRHHFHLASIHFTTSKSDVYMRLTILNHEKEIVSVEGKGSVILPAVLFMRSTVNTVQSQSSSRASSKTGAHKRSANSSHQGSISEITLTNKERIGSGRRSRSNSRVGLSATDGENRSHEYFIQVTLLRKSWPLTLTQWHFVEQLKAQEKNEFKILNRQLSPTKADRSNCNSATKQVGSNNTSASSITSKGRQSSSRSSANSSGRSSTGKNSAEKRIDLTKPHWTLRVVSDADKADQISLKKDNKQNEELLNMKKAWETLEAGRAEKAMKTRQKYLDSLRIKTSEQPSIETPTNVETTRVQTPPVIEQQKQEQLSAKLTLPRKKSPSASKKGISREESPKLIESVSIQSPIEEPLLDEPPFSTKPKASLPPLDIKPFIKRNLSLNESTLSEEEDFECRRDHFQNYLKLLNEIRQYRDDEQKLCLQEKIRQLEEYVNLQGKIDRIRRCMNKPREAYRQRHLEIEHQRLAIIVAEQQRLLAEEQAKAAAAAAAAALVKPIKKKNSAGKKKKEKLQ